MTTPTRIPNSHAMLKPYAPGVPTTSGGLGSFGGVLCGRVIRIDPANNTVDIALANGGIMHQVPVAQMLAGTTEGVYCLPNIKTPKKTQDQSETSQQQAGTQAGTENSEEDDSDGRCDWKDIEDSDLDTPTDERDVYAVVAYMNEHSRTPICLGFIPPASNELSIKARQEDKENRIDYLQRLTSKWYEVHTRGGVYEDDYPDGTHLRVGKPKKKKESSGSESQVQAGTQSSAGSSSTADEYYDDKDDDPDGRIVLGKDEYENIDKDDKPWKIKKSEDGFRWVVVHGKKSKFGLTEKGQFFFQDYNQKDDESDPPGDYTSDPGTRDEHKYNIGDQDSHQTRNWRSAWGDWETLPDEKVIDGEHLWDSKSKRDRYRIPAESDGTAGSMDTNRKWYTPAATPKGGGIKKKVKRALLKDHDYTATSDEGEIGSKDGVLIDASAADHEHVTPVAKDADIKDVNPTQNKGGTADYLARGDHEHKDTDSSSDERLKNNLGVISEVLPAIRELNVIRFTWNDVAEAQGLTETTEQIGLIAQEVNNHFPELIRYDDNGFMHLNYKKLSAVLVKGLQETNSRIDRIEEMLGLTDANK